MDNTACLKISTVAAPEKKQQNGKKTRTLQ